MSASPSPPGPGPNIVLLTIDTLRADRISPYGYEIHTPHIQRLANEGILFETAVADVTWTVPSLSSVMTGTYPLEHGVRSWRDRLSDRHETLAERLRDAGYATAAIVGSFPLDRRFGLSQGFDYYDDAMTASVMAEPTGEAVDEALFDRDVMRWMDQRSHSIAYRGDAEVAALGVRWLRRSEQSPFFLWLHFFGAHERDKQSDPKHHRAWVHRQIAEYDAHVTRLDRVVGRFMRALRADPRFASTVVVLHADHGQNLRLRGFGHGNDVFEPTARVPLVVRLPEAKRGGTRDSRLAGNLDLFSTFLGLAGLEAAGGDGRDLLSSDDAGDRTVYLETHAPLLLTTRVREVLGRPRQVGRIVRGVRTKDWKLVVSEPALGFGDPGGLPLPELYKEAHRVKKLYDLKSDPREQVDVAKRFPEKVAELMGRLDQYADRPALGEAPVELDESARERLRSLGYID